jgi:hypothetical protein
VLMDENIKYVDDDKGINDFKENFIAMYIQSSETLTNSSECSANRLHVSSQTLKNSVQALAYGESWPEVGTWNMEL